jgi:RNA polymerase sigma factor (sigma-70 family)
MPPTSLTAVVRHIRKLATPQDRSEASDAELLNRFRSAGDQAAFRALVQRHGRLVMGVCRRVLNHHQDAEDAFQATFLVLARNAATIQKKAALPSWLYGVAQRVAGGARRAASRRQARERRATKVARAQPDLELAWRELQAVLAEEVQRLPEKYQLPFVLCCLDGKSKAEAAAQLGWKEGTISSRLAEARKRMQKRLARRGLTLAVALCAADLSTGAASALPPALVNGTVRAALAVLGGKATSVSAPVIALVDGATKAMFTSKVKVATVMLLALGLLAAAAGTRIDRASADPPVPADKPLAEAKADEASAAKPPAGPAEKVAAADDRLPAGAVLRFGTTRLRPGGNVGHLAFSPDGTKVASWSSELYVTDSLAIWDVKTGRLLRRVDQPGGRVRTLRWLADGRGIALLQGENDGRPPLVWEFTDEKAEPGRAARAGGGIGVAPGAAGDDESDSCYAISPDGKTLAIGRSGNNDKNRQILLRPLKTRVVVSDLADPKVLAQQPGNCETLLFTPDGKRLIAINKARELAGGKREDEQLIVVWNVATGKETARFKAPRPAENGGQPAAAASDGVLAIGREDGSTSLWDLATGKETKLPTNHVNKETGEGYGTFAVAFSPDGKTLATGGRDHVVKQWDVATGRHLCTMERHFSWVEILAMSPDGRTIASAGQDGVIRLWEAATGKDACPQPGHLHSVCQVVLTPDGRTVLTASWDHTLRWWDATTGRELRKVDLPGAVNGLAVSPDGRTVLATVHEERLRTWDLASGRETTPADLPRGMQVGALSFAPGGRQLITASGPHVTILDWPEMKVRRTLELPKPAKEPGVNDCRSMTVSSDGPWLVTVAERSWSRMADGLRYGYAADGVVDVWDLTTGQRVRRLAESTGVFRSATFTADGRVVLVGAAGTVPAQAGGSAQEFKGEMALLDPVAGRWVRSFTPPPPTPGTTHRYTGATLLSPDGRTLYVSYNTGEIVGFEVATGQPRRTLSGHRGYVGALGLTLDGRRLISGGHEGSALLWDLTLAGAAKPRKEPLTAAEVDRLWEAAASTEAKDAFAAMADLAAAPGQAVALLRRQVKPIPAAPTDADLDRTFADLDSEDFATREKASQKLAEFGESVVPGVRKRLEKVKSEEVRKRALAFLEQFDPSRLSVDRLRQLRAVELLEGIATPEAKEMLSELAKGGGGAPLTLEAASALARLKRP